MGLKIKSVLGMVLSLALLYGGCAPAAENTKTAEDKLCVVATTTMLTDLSKVIGGSFVFVEGLMGPGIDPHLYQASAGDVTLLQEADVIVYNGLHLEGKMEEIFAALSEQGHVAICVGQEIDGLLQWGNTDSAYDPHIWFDVSLWKEAAQIVAEGLIQADPGHASGYRENLEGYLAELEETENYIRERVEEVPREQRVLVTAHDAFHYFGRAYGFEVRGLQGISTNAEAGTADVSVLAQFIADRRIRAIFVETSIPPKTIEALQAAVQAKGFAVAIGGELYSDSLGDQKAGTESYVGTVKANIDTIVEALKE